MGKRTEIFERFHKSFINLWKETIKDITRDFTQYLLENPLESGILGCFRYDYSGRTVVCRIFYFGEEGELYIPSDFGPSYPIKYSEDSLDHTFFLFNQCLHSKYILYYVLSEESRVDIKLILDRYYEGLEYLIEEGGVTKLKHIYPYLRAPISWNYRDSSIKSMSVDSIRMSYVVDSRDNSSNICLYGEYLYNSRIYYTTVSCLQNGKKVNHSITFDLNLEGLRNLLKYLYDDSNKG